uniref:Uncharacterized protein n=1 Tax=Anopheles epiroticus TaxID=199890 RepID=A0A182PHA2_9DIPT
RGLCCFPSLTTKKPIQSLLADEVSVLSTNNSETFLQNLAHIGSDRRSEQPPDRDQLGGSAGQKADDMVLLEKQGRCSQKLRGGSSSSSGTLGNLAHVSQAVGQNMTDISNIGGSGGGGGKDDASNGGSGNKVSKILSGVTQQVGQRGSSLPPSALPRPPRSLKPPRKIEYGRLSDGGGSDSGKKTRAATPPSPASSSGASQSGGSLKRSGREFSPAKGSYVEMKDTLQLTKDYHGGTSLKHKTYGSMTTVGASGGGGGTPSGGTKFGFGSSKSGTGPTGSGSDYPSTKNYQRLEEASSTAATSALGGHHHNNSSSQSSQSRKSSGDSGTLKRSLLPNTGRKPNVGSSVPKNGGSRDSLNSASSGSNHSNVGQTRSSPQPQPAHPVGSGYHQPHQLASRTPPRFLQQQHHHHQPSTSVESNKSHSNYQSMPTSSQSAQQFHQGFFAKFPGPHGGSPVRTLQQQQTKTSSSLPSSSILHAAASSSATSAIGQSSTASLPPKPSMLEKMVAGSGSSPAASQQQQQQQRRGSSLARVENKYRIQF